MCCGADDCSISTSTCDSFSLSGAERQRYHQGLQHNVQLIPQAGFWALAQGTLVGHSQGVQRWLAEHIKDYRPSACLVGNGAMQSDSHIFSGIEKGKGLLVDLLFHHDRYLTPFQERNWPQHSSATLDHIPIDPMR